MSDVRNSLKWALVGVILSCVMASTEQQAPLGSTVRPALQQGSPSAPAPAGTTRSIIHGTAVDNRSRPLPGAKVQLRNLQFNEIEQVESANQFGEFTFVVQPEIPYVVEIADRAGRIIAVGNVITAQVGEVAGAVVAIPTGLPALAGVFGQTAGSVVSAASSAGITAIEATMSETSVSPER